MVFPDPNFLHQYRLYTSAEDRQILPAACSVRVIMPVQHVSMYAGLSPEYIVES